MPRLRPALAHAVLVAGLLACRTAAPPPRPTRVPDPFPGPPATRPLSERERLAMYEALAAAERGDRVTAQRALRRTSSASPVLALAKLEVGFLLGEQVGEQAERLARAEPEYKQAWSFAAQVWQAEKRWAQALEMARRALQLGGEAKEALRVRELEALVVGGALERARAALGAGDADTAISLASEALAAVPAAVSLLEVLVRAYLSKGDVAAAARFTPALPDDAVGLELKGRVAMAGQQWDVAVEIFRRLPADYPGRCPLLEEARQRQRRAQAPPYVQKALAASDLTRAQLAALVVWEVPALAERAAGPVVVFEDIVNASERRDIVTVVRAGVMGADIVTRRFFPHRRVRPRELVEVVERLAAVMERPRPLWCDQEPPPSCLEIPAQEVTGEAAAAVLRRIGLRGDDQCP